MHGQRPSYFVTATRISTAFVTATSFQQLEVAFRAAAPDSIEFGEDAVDSAEDPLNVLGYRLLQEGRVPEAVAVFEMNVEAYPNEPNPHDSLGDGYSAAGRFGDAKRSYERAIERAGPDHPNIDIFRANLERVTEEFEGQ